MIVKFISNFPDIQVDLVLSNNQLDPIKEKLDLLIRGAGFINEPALQDSTMQMKLLLKEKIGLYASPVYSLLTTAKPRNTPAPFVPPLPI